MSSANAACQLNSPGKVVYVEVDNGTDGVGKVDVNLNGLVAAGGDSTPFAIHLDDVPNIFVPGQPSSGYLGAAARAHDGLA